MDILFLLAGVALAAIGGEIFVKGAVGLSEWLKIPSAIIGATVAAFATSSPELAVGVSAALKNDSAIAFGGALGSNVFNAGFILGFALLFASLAVGRDSIRRDLPLALAQPIVSILLVVDGYLSMLDAVILLAMFLGWTIWCIRDSKSQKSDIADVITEKKPARIIVELLLGLGLLVASGELFVRGGESLGAKLGWDTFMIGATFVAAGTSFPELATVILARIRGHDEVGLGTVLGSSLFNAFAIVGVVGVMRPFQVRLEEILLTAVAGLVTVAFCWPNRQGILQRWRGVALVLIFVAYTILLIQLRPGA